jgi:hypothetical protein
MKMRVYTPYALKEVTSFARVFETLYNIHKNPEAKALAETYDEAKRLLEELVGHEVRCAFAEDGTQII